MSRPEYEAGGFYGSNDPLSPNDRARLMRLLTGHLSQGHEHWPLDPGAPSLRILAEAFSNAGRPGKLTGGFLGAFDHAECAARLDANSDDSFGLLTRRGVAL